MASKDICVVCAWRADCKKKFTVSGKDIRCPDFTKDISIPEDKGEIKEDSRSERLFAKTRFEIPGVK